MKKKYCIILILFVFFILIKGEENVIEEAPDIITDYFECKLTKFVNSKMILPLSVELKNKSKSSVIISEKVAHRAYCQVLAEFSTRGKIHIST